ncbi:MAG: phage tail protein [Sphingomonadales bacterium]|nr:phage tail protein [Sphingomonadales bacterium]
MQKQLATGLASAALIAGAAPAQAGTDAYIGEIMLVGFTFCPRATTEANGQLLAISSNTALFSLYGTTYGGNGSTTFALPDLRSRVPIHFGQGPGLSNYNLGQSGGVETTTMTIAQMPAHNHIAVVNVSRTDADTRSPANAYFARAAGNTYEETTAPTGDQMNAGTVTTQNAGSGQAQTNIQPYLALRYCVVTQGIFPPRN